VNQHDLFPPLLGRFCRLDGKFFLGYGKSDFSGERTSNSSQTGGGLRLMLGLGAVEARLGVGGCAPKNAVKRGGEGLFIMLYRRASRQVKFT
jgi:hypothetical protein